MQLEDCTKAELIYFIRNSGFFSQKDLAREMQSCRTYVALKKQGEADEAGNRVELLGQVEGNKLADVPLNILREMDVAHKEWKRCCARSEKYSKEWDAAMAALKGAVDHEAD